jgi:hypothetical protein
MRLLFTPVFTICLAAQTQATRTYSPQLDQPSYTVWDIVACGQQDLPAGVVYRELATHGVGILFNAQANDRLTTVEAKSFWARAYTWGTYAAAGIATLMNLDVVKAKPSYVKAGNIASGTLSFLIPLAQKSKPQSLPSWYPMLLRDHEVIRVGPGDCQTAIVLGGRGAGFTVTGVP